MLPKRTDTRAFEVTQPLSARDRVRADANAKASRWYNPWVHLAFPSLVGLGLIAAGASRLEAPSLLEWCTVPVVFVLVNFNEWHIHRNILHRRTWPLEVLFWRHTPEHHVIFVRDDMAMRARREFRLVLIPFYGILAIFDGAHHCLNVVTVGGGAGDAVLVRGGTVVHGHELARRRRGSTVAERSLADGPGKLCQALTITRHQNGADLRGPDVRLVRGALAPGERVRRGARIGVGYAGAHALRPWRFYLDGNPHVSRAPARRRHVHSEKTTAAAPRRSASLSSR